MSVELATIILGLVTLIGAVGVLVGFKYRTKSNGTLADKFAQKRVLRFSLTALICLIFLGLLHSNVLSPWNACFYGILVVIAKEFAIAAASRREVIR